MANERLERDIAAALARADHDGAASVAIRGFGPEILGYLTRVLSGRGEAADAFSYFAEQLWRGLPGFAGRSSVRVWAYRVAWSAAVRVRSEAWGRHREHLPTSMASRIAGEVLSRTAEERELEGAHLARLRAALGPEEQSLLVLRVDRGLSWREVAEVMAEEGASEEEAGSAPPTGRGRSPSNRLDEPALRKRFERLKAKLAQLAAAEGLID